MPKNQLDDRLGERRFLKLDERLLSNGVSEYERRRKPDR